MPRLQIRTIMGGRAMDTPTSSMDLAGITMATARMATARMAMAAILTWYMVLQPRIRSKQETRAIVALVTVGTLDPRDDRHPHWV